RSLVPGDGEAVWGERRQRREVVPAVPGNRQRGGELEGGSCPACPSSGSGAAYWVGGHRRRVLSFEGGRILARLAEKPDLTLRALVSELVEDGIPASYGAVWRLLASEGITVKKKPVRGRAGSPRRGSPACPLEEVSGPAGPQAASLHRRDLGQDQHDPAARALPPPDRQGATGALAHPD